MSSPAVDVAIFVCEHPSRDFISVVPDPPKRRPVCSMCGAPAIHVGHDVARRILDRMPFAETANLAVIRSAQLKLLAACGLSPVGTMTFDEDFEALGRCLAKMRSDNTMLQAAIDRMRGGLSEA